LNLLRYVSGRHGLGTVATIGRQELALPTETRQEFGIAAEERYCEGLFRKLGAEFVHSFDVSGYEDPTHICDLNEPFHPERQYDTVCDFGSFEHVFDQATAFANIKRMTQIGGIVCHVLPVNNLNGHGFWQYSSDLLYEIYSVANGFEDTEVFYASSMNHRWWYRCPRPKAGVRVEALSLEPIILLSVSRKAGGSADPIRASQKFYDPLWQQNAEGNMPPPPSFKRMEGLKRALRPGTALYAGMRNANLLLGLITGTSRYSLSSRNPLFERIRVVNFVDSRAL